MSLVKEALGKWGQRIQQAAKAIDDVEAKLDCRRKEQRQLWRHIPVFANLEYIVPARTMANRTAVIEQNWLNGGEDVHFQGVMASVWLNDYPAAATPAAVVNFVKTDAGFAARRFSEGVNRLRYVDFDWNVRVGRTGQYLLSPANNGLMIGSTVIRKDRAGKPHWFSSALRVPAGENILFQVRPLRLPGYTASDTFWEDDAIDIRISVALYGTRTGALHGNR
jgi:hypothetical protein